jgi:cytochrome P450
MSATSVTTVPTLNMPRENPLVTPAVFDRLRDVEGISKVIMPSGEEAWLVLRHDLVREVLASDAMSADFFHLALLSKHFGSVEERIPGMFNRMDAPDHTRFRKVLQRPFTAPNIARLRPVIETLTRQTLEACAAAGPEVDFVSAFALPIPSLVICELLGVPYSDRSQFYAWSQVALDLTASAEAKQQAKVQMPAYIAELARQYRDKPGRGLIADLVKEHGDDFTNLEIGGLGFELLLAGHETTANMLSLCALIAMTDSAARALFTRDAGDDELDIAVRELLRYLSITHMSPLRRAKYDVKIGGVEIAAGDYVCCHVPAANRDPRVWSEADRLQLDRAPAPHLAFGFGAHLCLGQALARLELQIALPLFFRRFPGAEVTESIENLGFRHEMFVYGLHALPVRLF